MTTHVLGSLPTYLMSFFSLTRKYRNPKQEKQGLLLGSRQNMYWCSSLVISDKVCTPKNSGGLGVKNLHIQNVCLLMKSAFKFLHSTDITWLLLLQPLTA
jgi:hypothetical protein